MKKNIAWGVLLSFFAAVFSAGCAGPQVVRVDNQKKEAAKERMEKAAGSYDMTKGTTEEIDQSKEKK